MEAHRLQRCNMLKLGYLHVAEPNVTFISWMVDVSTGKHCNLKENICFAL